MKDALTSHEDFMGRFCGIVKQKNSKKVTHFMGRLSVTKLM
jgi:hypothetical protein